MHTSVPKDSPLGEWVLSLKDEDRRSLLQLLTSGPGLTMWVGLWDLLDAHLLPTLFDACVHEPSVGCGAVKLSLIAIGAFGLYLTRSLYGDTGGSGPVHFQRL